MIQVYENRAQSDSLYAHLTAALPFLDVLESVFETNLVVINDLTTCNRVLLDLRNTIELLSINFSPSDTLPCLLQLFSDSYFSNRKQTPDWLGTALKTSIAHIWKNIFSKSVISYKWNIEELSKFVHVCSIYDRLRIIPRIYDFKSDLSLLIVPEGIGSKDPSSIDLMKSWRQAFIKRGQLFRSKNLIFPLILKNPAGFIDAITAIIAGKKVHKLELFKGTFFNSIPEGSLAFWEGLYVRAILWLEITKELLRNGYNHEHVVLFPEIAIPILSAEKNRRGTDKNKVISRELTNAMWTFDWYKRNINDNASSLLSERPAFRLNRSRNIFLSTPATILDSIGWYTESSVMNYFNDTVKNLTSSVFETYISKPFEKNVITLLEEHSFLAGEVSRNGTWKVGNQLFQLKTTLQNKIPGQIDCLAYSKERRLFLVIDCKILSTPYKENQFRNLQVKLTDLDSEQFYHKLDQKLQWVIDSNIFTLIKERKDAIRFQAALVLDNYVPVMGLHKFDVYSIDQLKMFLQRKDYSVEEKKGRIAINIA